MPGTAFAPSRVLNPMERPQFVAASLAAESPMPPTTVRPRGVRRAPVRHSLSRQESDRFFRHLVAGMRNGVLAITRDGNVAEINAEAQRIFQLKRTQGAVGRHFSE